MQTWNFGWVRCMLHVWMCSVTHMDESCQHDTRMNESCQHVTRMNESCQHVTGMNDSCHTYGWVVSHVWIAHMNGSWCTYKRVVSHIWMSRVNMSHVSMIRVTHMKISHGTHITESWRTYEQVMALIWMSHVTHLNDANKNELCYTYEIFLTQGMWHILNELCPTNTANEGVMSHTQWMKESCHTHTVDEGVMSHTHTANEGWNSGWIKDCWGQDILQQVEQKVFIY